MLRWQRLGCYSGRTIQVGACCVETALGDIESSSKDPATGQGEVLRSERAFPNLPDPIRELARISILSGLIGHVSQGQSCFCCLGTIRAELGDADRKCALDVA